MENVVKNEQCNIFFGDAQSCPIDHKSNNFATYCKDFIRQRNLNHLTVLRQVHGNEGAVVSDATPAGEVILFEQAGDFLVTNQVGSALGILTADCLPVVVYDKVHHAVGIAHAGWRGTAAGITQSMLAVLQQTYGTKPTDLKVWLGPAARPCCYEVQQDFIPAVRHIPNYSRFIHQEEGKLFFDGTACNKVQLQEEGVTPVSIETSYNSCTMCDLRYHSSRRQTQLNLPQLRQLTLVWLSA